MAIHEENLHRGRPVGPGGTGALVIGGSSGRIDTGRVDMLAGHGVTAMGMRWFGGPGLPDAPVEVPLELFVDAVDVLLVDCDRVVLVGLSYGAEAVLLAASVDPRVAGVVAMAPTDVAWEGRGTAVETPPRSKWTWGGAPVPFVPLDRDWVEPSGKPAYTDLYLSSRAASGPDVLAAAAIPVERISGEVVLVAGGDDLVWPSQLSAEAIAARREEAGLPTTLVVDPAAGHPVVLPGEPPAALKRPYLIGGDDGAPERLGRLAWPAVARLLHVRV